MKQFIFLLILFQLGSVMDAQNQKNSSLKDTATFGGGCFWCIEAVFEKLNGVSDVISGYAGGQIKNPSYKEVCTGRTGHAEVVQIVFDPLVIRYEDLLDIFFTVHDPTTLNKQGADIGTQYRSVIFYHNDIQKAKAEKFISHLSGLKTFEHQIVTELKQLTDFYKAEDYHQDYFENNPNQPYCSVVISPKIEKFKKKYKNIIHP